MSELTFFVSNAALRNLKHGAQSCARGVRSSHLSEALASALGFRTHAALCAALHGRTTVEVPKPSNARMVQRLHELGYTNIEQGQRIVPEFDQSYFVFRNAPLRKARSVRWWAWRNLMVMGINAGLEQRLFGLSPSENWWPGGHPDGRKCHQYAYRFMAAGNMPAVASVKSNEHDEISICVMLNPKRDDVMPEWYLGLGSANATAHGWLERKLGAWIQDDSQAFHCKRDLKPQLVNLDIEPAGYSDQGSFIL
ncbi:MAG: hypothetical protein JNK17_06025 [Hydrogenophaga sp.]|nr:hypothetical protein [Hydrogenophaga sp.]